jgi:hypothetical protein
MGVEMGAAFTAALAVSPFVYAIAMALMASAGGQTTFRREFVGSIRLIATKPWRLITQKQHRLPFGWMVALYGATYIVDNGVGRLLTYWNHPAETVTPCPLSGHLHTKEDLLSQKHRGHDDTGTLVKFGATAFTNVVMCTLKDKAYAQLFASEVSHSIPRSSYGLFILRDSGSLAHAS